MPRTTTTPSPAPYTATSTSTGPVIVAVGGRDPLPVLRAARDLASTTARDMVALAVLEPYQQYVTGLEPMFLPPAFDSERAALRLGSLRDQLRDVGAATAGWRAEVIHGATGPAIAEMAQALNASMIIMGIGRHRPIDRLLGGETTLQAIRHAPCPVLAVVPDTKPPFRHVVIATDFGPASARAAELVMPMLASGAMVSFVHVWQPAELPDDRLTRVDKAYADSLPDRFHRLHEALHFPAGVVVKDIVREGNPAECVLDHAAAQHADLVVAGRRKLRMLARLAVGSVTTAMLRGATCSVLVTPEPSFADTDRFRRLLTGKSETRDPAQWVVQLREFTTRNQGRRVSLEVDDLNVGAQVSETGYRLVNVAYEPRQRRLEIEVGTADGADRHVTRRIAGVEEISVVTDARGNDTALQVTHGPGQTVLSFMGK